MVMNQFSRELKVDYRKLQICFRYCPLYSFGSGGVNQRRHKWYKILSYRIPKSKREHRLYKIFMGLKNK